MTRAEEYQGWRRLFWQQVRRAVLEKRLGGAPAQRPGSLVPFRWAYERMMGRSVTGVELLRRAIGDPEVFEP
jgi:hypothetical protein